MLIWGKMCNWSQDLADSQLMTDMLARSESVERLKLQLYYVPFQVLVASFGFHYGTKAGKDGMLAPWSGRLVQLGFFVPLRI
jgi:hypothetical protein